MKQETVFLHSDDPRKVNLNPDKVKQIEEILKFEPSYKYYLRLPEQAYLPIVLFCLTATKDSLTKKSKGVLDKLQEGFRKEIEELYLSKNQKRQSFIGPYELEIFSNTANYNQKLFKNCQTKFAESDIIHSLYVFKEKFKVGFFSQLANKQLGTDKKLEKPQQVIFLLKDNNSIIICAYSSKPKPVKKDKRATVEELLPENKEQLGKKRGDKMVSELEQQQREEEEEQSKLHYSYTAILVLILAVVLYFSFAEIDPSFFYGTFRFQKSILQQLIEGVDSATYLIFGPK